MPANNSYSKPDFWSQKAFKEGTAFVASYRLGYLLLSTENKGGNQQQEQDQEAQNAGDNAVEQSRSKALVLL